MGRSIAAGWCGSQDLRYVPRIISAAPERDPRNHLLQHTEFSGGSTNCPYHRWAQRNPGTHSVWGLLPWPSTLPALPTEVMDSNSYVEKTSRVASAFLTKPWQIYWIWDQLQACLKKRKVAQGNCSKCPTELRPDLPSRTSCAVLHVYEPRLPTAKATNSGHHPDPSSHTPHPILSAFPAEHAQKLPLAPWPPAPCRPELPSSLTRAGTAAEQRTPAPAPATPALVLNTAGDSASQSDTPRLCSQS